MLITTMNDQGDFNRGRGGGVNNRVFAVFVVLLSFSLVERRGRMKVLNL